VRLYLESSKSYEKVAQCANILGPLTMRCNAQIRRRPNAKAAARAPQVYRKKTLKMSFLGENAIFRKNFEILFQQFS